jgi:general secretion pathway protein J
VSVSPRSRGFTLIEVLVALALMAMIATILIASLQIGGHTWQRVARATTQIEDIAQAQSILRRQLSTLYLHQSSTRETSALRSLVSDGHQLEYSSLAPLARAAGIWRYQVSLATSTGTLTIRSRHVRNGGTEPALLDWSEETLLKSVATLTIQFWLQPEDAPARWVDQWVDSNALPRLIRVEVTFAHNDPRRWPPFYVEPRVDTSALCVFDVVSRRCRGGA